VNAIEFWRRWHMTLSRFLRNYLYIPLGGSRKGATRRYANLIITMLLGGLWHGAGWNFAIWGALHGAYLMINHGWHALRRRLGSEPGEGTAAGRAVARALTFLAVLLAWVFFRAPDLAGAALMLRAMTGAFPAASSFPHDLFRDVPAALAVIAALSGVVWFAPNTQQIMARFEPGLPTYSGALRPTRWRLLRWRPSPAWALLTALVSVFGVLGLSGVSEFLYFQF
jgi:alginate O-acetyltransferase complex protein AlgI